MREIRKITEKDIPECVRVIKRSFLTVAEEFGLTAEKDTKFTAFATTEQRLEYHMFVEKRPMYACFVDGKIAGYYSLRIDGSEVELSNLCTLPEYRHNKIGESLLCHSFDKARELGFTEMVIGVVDANERVKRWYENYGFVKSGECDDYLTFHCVFMKKSL